MGKKFKNISNLSVNIIVIVMIAIIVKIKNIYVLLLTQQLLKHLEEFIFILYIFLLVNT